MSIYPVRGTVQVPKQTDPEGGLLGRDVLTAVYIAALALSAGGLAFLLIEQGYGFGPLWAILPLVALGAVSERKSIRLSQTIDVSISLLPLLFAAVVFGPLPAMAVGAGSMLGELRPPYLKWGVYSLTNSINGALTALVASLAAGLTGHTLGSITLATVAGAITAQALDSGFAALTLAVRRSGQALESLRLSGPALPTTVLLYAALVSPVAYAYDHLSPWTLLFFLAPTLAAQRLWVMYQEQRRLATDLGVVNEKLERANLSFASALVTTLDARDRYTAGHSADVAVYARDIAERLGLPPDQQQLAHLSGLLHDIGKIGVPPGILEKNGPLTLQERRKMEEHSVIGERILANVEAYSEIADIVRHHHERIDGEGYPDGIVRDQIPVISRIICVADAYSAMTSDRPYRDAMPVALARDRLKQAAGSQFDEAVVEAFDSILETAGESYSKGGRVEFEREAQMHPELVAPAAAASAA